ncbi:factor-independent urate hydroxylase [Nitriliruptor alkaliphilus]|uniref:factor-independent urate hydroxylase n=1 Tax=Nitriliruptor alkaliphilus TaxID=427918 RepID=UPI0006985BB9|nr:urate oxidase [Nitriliruptor alkaliphilus]
METPWNRDGTHLGPNRYGKSGIRLVTVARDGDRHTFTDLDIEVRLEGDFEAVHTEGDNTPVLPTDTMRGTCFALARGGIDSVAGYAGRLSDRFLEASSATSRVMVRIVSMPWDRVEVDGAPHDHTFRPAGGGQAVLTLTQERGLAPVITGGVRGARVLKTTGSAFSGYLEDEYTTLPPTRDRIMATTIDATWGTVVPDADHAALAAGVPATILARFATHDDSESVQHTLHAMGQAVLDEHPDVTWIRFRLPNEHHILADLSPYGLDNPNEVYLVADRPFGVIEGSVVREGRTPEPGW